MARVSLKATEFVDECRDANGAPRTVTLAKLEVDEVPRSHTKKFCELLRQDDSVGWQRSGIPSTVDHAPKLGAVDIARQHDVAMTGPRVNAHARQPRRFDAQDARKMCDRSLLRDRHCTREHDTHIFTHVLFEEDPHEHVDAVGIESPHHHRSDGRRKAED